MGASDLVHKQNAFQYLKGENRLERKQIVLCMSPWISLPYRRHLSLTSVHFTGLTIPVVLWSKRHFFPQPRVNLDASLVSVWDRTNVDAFQDTPGKPAVKVSTTDQGGNTDLPQSFQKQIGQCSGVWNTVRCSEFCSF